LRVQEIRTFGLMELENKLNESYRELFNLRFRLSTRQLVNYHEIGKVKKRIARIKTVMREIELSTEE
jgi:large subunit ribosomal protein L29